MEAELRLGAMASLIFRQLFASRVAFILGVVIIVFAALLLMVTSTQQSFLFSRNFFILLLINAIGVILLLSALIVNTVRVFGQYRRQEAGARLTVRLITLFAFITIIPTALVFFFSMQFLSKGIDSWFDERIERALVDAGSLGQISIEAISEESFVRLEGLVSNLVGVGSDIDLIRTVNQWRIDGDYDEISVFDLRGQILAFSRADLEAFPSALPRTMSASPRQSDVEIGGDGSWLLRQIVRSIPAAENLPATILAVKRLPARQSTLATSVDTALSQYGQLKFLRGRLKQNYALILSLIVGTVALMTLWISVYLAKLTVRPVRELLAATEAVAAGNYDVKLSDWNRTDEFGTLLSSFNVMTKRVHLAQNESRQHAQTADNQRQYLATILEHIRTGVLGLNEKGLVSVINLSGLSLLRLNEGDLLGKSPIQITREFDWLKPLFNPLIGAKVPTNADNTQMDIWAPYGKMVLRVSYSPTDLNAPRAGVVVFDDLTTLLKAQRDAAWGEVARRLAHEIKNPLTPIQLSAERLRSKFSDLGGDDLQRTLVRSTGTIVNQVESLKSLVNDFSRYAQPVDVQLAEIDIVGLANEIVDLFRHSVSPATITVHSTKPEILVTADSTRMRQVLTNLILNASESQANREGLTITVDISPTQHNNLNMVKISIRDNGPGFAVKILERLFEPYASTKGRGSGLGLAIVKRIIDEHSGFIDAYNDDGAVIDMYIPLARES